MKRTLVAALSAVGLLLSVNSAMAADKEIKGEGQCLKCSLKKAESCQNAIVAKEDGKEVVYVLAQNDISKKFHKNLCQGKKKVKAVGTVKEVDGKKELTVSKIELDEAS